MALVPDLFGRRKGKAMMVSARTKAFVAKTHTILYGIGQRLNAFERGDSPAKACNATAARCASNPPRSYPTSARLTQRLISMEYLLLILFFIAPISKAGQCIDGTYYDFNDTTASMAGPMSMCYDDDCQRREAQKAQRLQQAQEQCYRQELLEQQRRQNDLLERQRFQLSPPTTTTNCYRNYDGSITCTTQ